MYSLQQIKDNILRFLLGNWRYKGILTHYPMINAGFLGGIPEAFAVNNRGRGGYKFRWW